MCLQYRIALAFYKSHLAQRPQYRAHAQQSIAPPPIAHDPLTDRNESFSKAQAIIQNRPNDPRYDALVAH